MSDLSFYSGPTLDPNLLAGGHTLCFSSSAQCGVFIKNSILYLVPTVCTWLQYQIDYTHEWARKPRCRSRKKY